jgi:hypothetical protein
MSSIVTISSSATPVEVADAVTQAVECVRGGGLAVIPTDTSYAVVADAFNGQALEQLRVAKGYLGTVPLPVAAASIDTDSDGLDDLFETNTGIYISPTNTGTNPSSADTDGDGVPDGLEVKEKTSPVDATKFNSFSKGMVAYYPFNGSADDKSGSGHSGTVSGATLAGDRFGAAGSSYSFDGTSNFIEANLGTVLSCPITMSVWFLSDQIVSPTRGLASIPSLTYQSGLRLGFENGKVEGGSQGGGGTAGLVLTFCGRF